MDADPNSATRTVELMGSPDAIATAEKLINEVLAEVLPCCLYLFVMLEQKEIYDRFS